MSSQIFFFLQCFLSLQIFLLPYSIDFGSWPFVSKIKCYIVIVLICPAATNLHWYWINLSHHRPQYHPWGAQFEGEPEWLWAEEGDRQGQVWGGAGGTGEGHGECVRPQDTPQVWHRVPETCKLFVDLFYLSFFFNLFILYFLFF